MRRLWWTLLLLIPSVARAQGDCSPPKDSHEARIFAKTAVPFAFAPALAPSSTSAWSVRLVLETSYLPHIDSATSTPTICYPGKGPENTNFGRLLPRPRVMLDLPAGFVLEASWVPPVKVNGAEPNLFAFALGKNLALGRRGMTLGLRAQVMTGVIHAPITCDKASLSDPNSTCFNGTLSHDEYHPRAFGGDATVGWSLGGGRVQPFVGGGVNFLRPRFRVNFTDAGGTVDRSRIEVDLTRAVFFAGASWYPRARLGVSGQIYSAPSDAVTGRVAVSYELGPRSPVAGRADR